MRNKELILGLMVAVGAASGQESKMTARDMFYSAAGLVAPPAKATVKTPGAKKATGATVATGAKVATGTTGAPAVKKGPVPVPGPRDEGPQVILASQKTAGPLGLRYSILKEDGGGTVEVDADTAFRSGDRIRLTVRTNDRAHLYIVQRGSSGNWGVLFPSQEINGGNNVIEKDRAYEVPAGHWWAFDEQPGKERLFIVLSRQPEPNLEKMMYQLKQGDGPPPPPEKMLVAQDRPINDSLVQRVKSEVYARDLVFEKVDDKTPGEKKEKAVYVVNKTGSAESRVVTDVTLNHQ